MEQKTAPLLTLDDRCLLDIMKFLELKDFVNFANTCFRLRNIARFNKYKNIYVSTATQGVGFNGTNMYSKVEFLTTMSLIGEHVVTAHTLHGSNYVYEIIGANCKNLQILKASPPIIIQKPIQLHGFDNLKELKLNASLDHFKFLPRFANNIIDLDLKSRAMIDFKDESKRKRFYELLDLFPKVKSLNLGYLHNIYCLNSLDLLPRIKDITSFSFESKYNYNALLMKLSDLKLVKLCFDMELNANTFDIVQQFQNLEDLVMKHGYISFQKIQFPETSDFPPNLKSVKLENIYISWRKLSSIIEKSKYLEVIDLGFYACIYFDDDKFKYFPNEYAGAIWNRELITRIDEDIQRTLTIKYSHTTQDEQAYVYKSKNLKVINTWITDNQEPKEKEKIERIFLKLDSVVD